MRLVQTFDDEMVIIGKQMLPLLEGILKPTGKTMLVVIKNRSSVV